MGKAAREKFKLKKQNVENGNKNDAAIKRQAFKKPRATRNAIRQYLILAVCLLPILLGLAYLFNSTKAQVPLFKNGFFIITVYAIIIVLGWLVWLKIRTKFEIRAERIRKAKEAQQQIIEAALAQQKREEAERELERQKAIKRAAKLTENKKRKTKG